MARSYPVPWSADPHTKAKHALYRQYLSKWMPIMVKGWKANITYAEGFAGPGVYADGSPGSPVIALRSLIGDPDIRMKVRQTGVRFVFVDHDPRCIELLPNELARAAAPVLYQDLSHHGVHITVARGDCEPTLAAILEQNGAFERPILAVLDTWGSAVSADLIKRFAYPGGEVVVTIKPQYFSRFAEVQDIDQGDRVFGDSDWRAVANHNSSQKRGWLLQQYRNTIRKAGFTHVLDFELVDSRGESLYLVFGTTSAKGLTKMKEAMWEVDSVSGIGYRDPRDPAQQMLDIEIDPNTGPLQRLITEFVRTHAAGYVPIFEVRKFALHQTVYKESQAMVAVRALVASGALERLDGVKTDAGLTHSHQVRVPPIANK